MKKLPIWDILTGVLLLGVVCLACGLGYLLLSPAPLNLFPPQPTITRVVIIIPTETSIPRVIPPTWTPGSPAEQNTPVGEVPTLEPATAIPARTLRPTSTPEITNTPYIAPTMTPLPTFTPLPSATSASARCYITNENPIDNAEFSTSQYFDKSWTIKNNSGKTWQSNNTDIRYSSNSSRILHQTSDVFDLPGDISHGASFNLSIRMRAPDTIGTYTENWVIVADGDELCRFYVKIVVK